MVFADSPFECRTCTDALKEAYGCNGLDEPYEIATGITIDKCPIHYVDNQALFYIEMYAQYVKGFYPEEGGALDQPLKIMEAFRVIDRVKNEKESSRYERK